MLLKADENGCVTIPANYLRALNVNENDEVEVFVFGYQISIQKHILKCVFCGSKHQIMRTDETCICRLCLKKLYENDNLYGEA